MANTNIETLNNRFGIDNKLQFGKGNAGLTKIELFYRGAMLELYLHGAHITRYKPSNCNEVLWMSDTAVYRSGKALRGGIPLCWPWFGPHQGNPNRPQHGYARTSPFCVLSTFADDKVTSIILTLDPEAAPFAEWKNRARLEIEVRLSDSLWMEMRTFNISDNSLIVSNALHTYFSILGRDSVTIPDITGLTYLDKLQGYKQVQQTVAITIDAEVDRVYQSPPLDIDLIDTGGSTTSIRTWGNNNLVVWNPGETNAKSMADFDDRGFEQMLCIEPANALNQCVKLNARDCHRLGQQISVVNTE